MRPNTLLTRSAVVPRALLFGICMVSGFAVCAQTNPLYTYSFDAPCGETILGTPGRGWDDDTGGGPFFEGNPPGQTWDVILTSPPNNDPYGVETWGILLEFKGPVRLTGATVNGTAGCVMGEFPECRAAIFHLQNTLIDPRNMGESLLVWSFVALDPGGDFDVLPPVGTEKVLKVRFLAQFPEKGETAIVRVRFVDRDPSVRNFVVQRPIGTPIELDKGNPPLMAVPCEVFLKGASVAAFIRCDANDDGRLNLTDAVWIFTELFGGSVVTRCPAAADCNGDGKRNLTDGVYGLGYLFAGGPPPRAPFPECGRQNLPQTECPLGSTICP